MTHVFPDDMARGVVGLVAEIRDTLEAHATGVEEDGYDVRAVVLDTNNELRDVVEALVAVAEKYGAKP